MKPDSNLQEYRINVDVSVEQDFYYNQYSQLLITYHMSIEGQQQTITFQSKFAARKAQEDKAFLGLYGGAMPNQEHRVSGGDLGASNHTDSNKKSLTQDGGANSRWDRQRLTSVQNPPQQSQWVSPGPSGASQSHSQTYKPISNSAYAGTRLAGSSSNSRLNQSKTAFDAQGRDYRATMQGTGPSSLNYDETDGRFGVGRYEGSRQTTRDPALGTIRGRSTDAAQSGAYPYKYGQEMNGGQPAAQGKPGATDPLAPGAPSYNLYNQYNNADLGRNYTNIGTRNRSGRSDFSLEPGQERSAGHSASVGKPSLGGYGYSAGAVAGRKLEYTADAARTAAPFEIVTKDHFGRNSHPAQTGNEFGRAPGKYGDYRAPDRLESQAKQGAEEVTDGYTEYFSQGCDYYGQLGHGQDPAQHDRNRHVNVPKSLSFDILIKQVSCGGSHTLILSKQGELFSIGSNEYGQLGLNDRQLNFTTAPLLVQEVQSKGLQVQQIASGQNHCLILAQNGQVFSWGSNVYGQCGHGKSTSGQNSPTFMQGEADMNRIYAPHRLRYEAAAGDYAKDVLAGENFSGFLTVGGDAYAFGDNSEGQLGVGSGQSCLEEPRKVQLDEQIVQASLGYQHMLLLTRSGRVYGAGRNREHQLGLGSHQPNAEQGSSVPVRIEAIREVQVLKVVAGGFSAALIQNAYDRQLVVWGQGDFGIFEKPQKLYMDGVDFVDVQIGKFSTNSPFAVALEKSGKVYSWGSNTLGQLGHGDQRVRKLPTQIQSLKRKTINKMSIGHNFVVMLGRDVSQAEQEKKKLKRKMQKEAKERERQQRNKAKAAGAQDENKTPIDINGMDVVLKSKERDFERRDSNQPATPKLPGESGRDSLGVISSANRHQDSYGRSRPKSANQTSQGVLGIIDEMSKIQNKGQNLLERVKSMNENRQPSQRTGRSGHTKDVEPGVSTRETRERSANAEDSRAAYRKSLIQGPRNQASFGQEPIDMDGKAIRSDTQKITSPLYAPNSSYLEKLNGNSVRQNSEYDRREQDQKGYQPMSQERTNQYRAEIQDLRQQLLKAKDTSQFRQEINDLKFQLQRAQEDNTQLQDDYRQVKLELDQERIKNSSYQDNQSRELSEVEKKLYQKDHVLNELRVELADKVKEYKDAQQTIMDQNNKIQQVEQSYDQLKQTYESKLVELDHEKGDIAKELDEAALKNQQLMTIVKEKQQELHDTKKIADQAKTMQKQLAKLEDIIEELQLKNKELNELVNRKMIERADSYKQQVVEYLNKPKSYEMMDQQQQSHHISKVSEKNSQYRRLGDEVQRDQYSHAESKDYPSRKSLNLNERSFQDYRQKDETFESQYGKNLHVNHSIALPERQHLLNNNKSHYSDKKQTVFVDQHGNEIRQDEKDQKKFDSIGSGGEQKTRSLPRYSKTNKLSQSPFFHGRNQEQQVQERDMDRYDQYANKKMDLKSDYERNRNTLGQSIESPFHGDRRVGGDRELDLDRSRHSHKVQQYYREDVNRLNDSNREQQYQHEAADRRYENNASFRDMKDGQEHEMSRSRFDPDGSMGRPPLNGQRVVDRDSAERRHQRVRSGNPLPQNPSSRVENVNHFHNVTSESHNNSRAVDQQAFNVRSSRQLSNNRSEEARYSGRRAVSNPGGGNSSQRAGSGANSREALSIRSREQARVPTLPDNCRGITTTQSKTRKEYVDITEGSEVSDQNRKVHRIDLAQDDQEDIQKQIQNKLTRIQKIFQGQQAKQGGDTSSQHNSNYHKEDATASITGHSKLVYDDTSLNDRVNQPTKDINFPVDVSNLSDRQIDRQLNNGSKTPVSEIKPADFEVMNLKGGSFYRVQSKNGSAVGPKSEHREGEFMQQHHERRNSLSYFGQPLNSQRQELEGGSYTRQVEDNDFGGGSLGNKNNSYTRPGEMRYNLAGQQDGRD